MFNLKRKAITVVNPILYIQGKDWLICSYDNNEYNFYSPESGMQSTNLLDIYFHINQLAFENKGTDKGFYYLSIALIVGKYLE